MAAHAQPRLTPEQYLELDRAAEFRNEYHDGVMYAMSGGSFPHAIIIGNLTGIFWSALRKGPCAVSPTELRVRLAPRRSYVYPDMVVACEPREFADDQKDTLLNPSLIIEVLSPSTEAYDRGLKSARYRMVPSLGEYALVWQIEPRVEIYRRQTEGQWLFSEFIGLEATAEFTTLPGGTVRIPLAEIYDKITFEALPEPTSPSEPKVP